MLSMNYFLFSDASVIDGIAANIDLHGVYTEYNKSTDEQTADSIAIWNDWATIGQHILQASEELENELAELNV